MGLLVLLVVAATLLQASDAQSCSAAACPRSKTYFLKHYEELGCTPTYDITCCPTVYNCSTLANRPIGKCRYNKVDYSVGQPLAANSGLPCKSCSCANTTMGMGFQCATQRCPNVRLPSNCVQLFEFNSCCLTNIKCKTNTTVQAPEFTCKIGNQTYFEGQMMPSTNPCKSCICQKGFDGTLNGPWCRNNSCGLELDFHATFNRGCVPVYYKDAGACCPLRWRCPSTKDYVVSSPAPTTTITKVTPTTLGPTSTTTPAKLTTTMVAMTTAKPITTVSVETTKIATTVGSTTTDKPIVPMSTKLGPGRRRRDAPYSNVTPVVTPSTTKASSTIVTPVTLPANVTLSAMTCTFGSLRLKVSDKLSSTSDKCIECTCTVPPYVTCLLEPRCSPWA